MELAQKSNEARTRAISVSLGQRALIVSASKSFEVATCLTAPNVEQSSLFAVSRCWAMKPILCCTDVGRNPYWLAGIESSAISIHPPKGVPNDRNVRATPFGWLAVVVVDCCARAVNGKQSMAMSATRRMAVIVSVRERAKRTLPVPEVYRAVPPGTWGRETGLVRTSLAGRDTAVGRRCNGLLRAATGCY